MHAYIVSGMPDFSQRSAPVLAQNQAKVLIGVSASDESSREIVDSFLSFEAGHHLEYEEESEVLELNPAHALQVLMNHVEAFAQRIADQDAG